MGKKFEAPGNLQELDADALAAAVNEAYAAAEELAAIDDAEITDEQFAELSAINEFVVSALEENGTREAAAAERSDALAAIRANLAPKPAEGEAEAEAEAEAAPEGDFAKLPEDIGDGGKDDAEEDAKGKKVQKASVQKPASFAARAARNAPVSVVVSSSSTLAAAVGVPGVVAGEKFSTLEEGAQILQDRLNAMNSFSAKNAQIRNSALVIELPANKFTTDRSSKDDSKMLLEAAGEKRLTGGSLVAAGGWGAPSEQSLDFCKLESIEGLISLPEVTVNRPGVSYTKGPVFADVVANSTGFWDMTEATAEAGTELKTSLRPAIPTFQEKRLDAVGVMMEAGLLLRQGWPEVIARYSELLLTAHQYKIAQKKLAGIISYTGAAKPVVGGFGNALDILHIIELIAIGERQRNFMSPKQTLEALIPYWVHAVIRADLAQRNGVDTVTITDAQIDAHFTARGVKVQWLNAWQNLVLDGTTKLATTYPTTVEVIMYPAGTFVAGVAPVITLDTIYDSTNLKKNDYVELFVEQGIMVTNPCGDGQRISFPLYANGRRAGVTDAAVTAGQNDNLFKAAVANA